MLSLCKLAEDDGNCNTMHFKDGQAGLADEQFIYLPFMKMISFMKMNEMIYSQNKLKYSLSCSDVPGSTSKTTQTTSLNSIQSYQDFNTFPVCCLPDIAERKGRY